MKKRGGKLYALQRRYKQQECCIGKYKKEQEKKIMSEWVVLIVGFAIAAILMLVEYLLCTKLKNPLWGGIIPILILIGTIIIFASGKVPLETRYLFPFVIVNTLFFGDWGTGRDKYKKIRQNELEKMSAKDME